MRIDGAVRDGQAQPGNEKIFEVFPDLFGIGFFVFHDLGPEHADVGARSESEIWNDQGKREQERERAANGAILVWKDHEVNG